jgi:hypothetical protein
MRLLTIFEQKVDFYLFWYAEASAMRLFRPSASRPCVIWGIEEWHQEGLENGLKRTNSSVVLKIVRKCLAEYCRSNDS